MRETATPTSPPKNFFLDETLIGMHVVSLTWQFPEKELTRAQNYLILVPCRILGLELGISFLPTTVTIA